MSFKILSRTLMRTCVLVLYSVTFHSASAFADDAQPRGFADPALVCSSNGTVDKDSLAHYFTSRFDISEKALRKSDPSTPMSTRKLLSALIKDPEICKNGCAPDDYGHLLQLATMFINLQEGFYAPDYALERQVAPDTLLDEPDTSVIKCAMPKPPSPASAGFWSHVSKRVRVRGKAEDLAIPQTEMGFESTEKASISIKSNAEDHTRAVDGQGYVGVNIFPDSESGARHEMFIYIGGKRTTVKTSGQPDLEKEKKSANAGLLVALFRPTLPLSYLVTIRPDYLKDFADHSRILSGHAEFTPYTRYLNTFTTLPTPIPKSFWKIVFSVPFDSGRYLQRKDNAIEGDQPNFRHLGARLGISIISDARPIEFTTVYTSLRALRGNIDVNHLRSDLTLNFDKKKHFGITLAYKRGRMEDTFKNEKTGVWS